MIYQFYFNLNKFFIILKLFTAYSDLKADFEVKKSSQTCLLSLSYVRFSKCLIIRSYCVGRWHTYRIQAYPTVRIVSVNKYQRNAAQANAILVPTQY